MNGSDGEITNSGGPVSSTEPSMEEILASIRRILKDEPAGSPGEMEPEEDEILLLDSSMVVRPAPIPVATEPTAPEPPLSTEPVFPQAPEEPQLRHPEPVFEPPAEAALPHLTSEPATPDFPDIENETLDLPNFEAEAKTEATLQSFAETGPAGSEKEIFMSDATEENVQLPHGLVGETATNAAASSIGSLIRSISSERSVAIGRPGLTLEDLVREELRPLLKSWLDSNLPGLVERIVRAEIQRVVERTGI